MIAQLENLVKVPESWHRDLQELESDDKRITEEIILQMRCGDNTKLSFTEGIGNYICYM